MLRDYNNYTKMNIELYLARKSSWMSLQGSVLATLLASVGECPNFRWDGSVLDVCARCQPSKLAELKTRKRVGHRVVSACDMTDIYGKIMREYEFPSGECLLPLLNTSGKLWDAPAFPEPEVPRVLHIDGVFCLDLGDNHLTWADPL